MFPLSADLHFSQAKGGAAPTVCMILMMLMVKKRIFMLFGGWGGMNGHDTDLQTSIHFYLD